MSTGGNLGSTTGKTNLTAPITPMIPGANYQSTYNPEAILSKSMPQMPNYQSGLQAAMMQIMQQYNRPMMRPQMQQGLTPYNSPALSYKPNMSNVTANLNRVVPSVAEQQRLQGIEDARIAAEKAAYDAANPPLSGPYYDGAGG